MDLNQRAEYLAETYADAILRLSYTYLKSTHDAQDICQTVFVKLLAEPRTFETPEHERSYVLRMAANACKDLLKSPWRKRTCGLEACAQIPAPEATDGSLLEAVEQPAPHYRARHLPLLLRGLPGGGDRAHFGRAHRHRSHPAGPRAGKAERLTGRRRL